MGHLVVVELGVVLEDEGPVSAEIVFVGVVDVAKALGWRPVEGDDRGFEDREFKSVVGFEVRVAAELGAVFVGGSGTEVGDSGPAHVRPPDTR